MTGGESKVGRKGVRETMTERKGERRDREPQEGEGGGREGLVAIQVNTGGASHR